MAFESTAVNKLINQVHGGAIEREPENWLFGQAEGGDLFAEQPTVDLRAEAEAEDAGLRARLAELRARAVEPLSEPFPPIPAREVEQSTAVVHKLIEWRAAFRRFVVPAALFVVALGLLAVYLAKGATPRPDATAVASTSAPHLLVMPIESAPNDVAVQAKPAPTVPTQPAQPALGPPVVQEPPAEAPHAAPKVDVPPGSPASRFLAATPIPPTVTPTATKRNKAVASPSAVATAPTAALVAPTARAVRPVGHKKSSRGHHDRRAAKRVATKPTKRPTQVATAADARAPTRAPKAGAKVAQQRDDQEDPLTAGSAQRQAADDDAKPAKTGLKRGKGVLSISSNPPAEVWVDGRNSKAVTPIRILLLAGTHNVSLIDDRGKAKSFDVVIKPDQTTKVSK